MLEGSEAEREAVPCPAPQSAPQVIDGRVVDLKLAIPDVAGAARGESPKALALQRRRAPDIRHGPGSRAGGRPVWRTKGLCPVGLRRGRSSVFTPLQLVGGC